MVSPTMCRGRRHGSYGSGGGHRHTSLSSAAKETATSLAPDSPVLALFRSTALKLNDRHDRHERLVKLSRDLTIESKRVIFLLHSAISKEDAEKAITEANDRLTKLVNGPIKAIAFELENSPNYQHTRPVSPGLQEFIEAKTLCHILQHKTLPTCSQVQKEFVYHVKEKIKQADIKDISQDIGIQEKGKGTGTKEESEETDIKEIAKETGTKEEPEETGIREKSDVKPDKVKTVVTLLPPVDFILGIADLTGELMRRTINSLSSGDSEECFHSCQVVRDLYTGFMRIHGGGREISRKMSTIRANVSKVESAVYALHVRGGEAPPSLLLPAAPPHINVDVDQRAESDDEGYF